MSQISYLEIYQEYCQARKITLNPDLLEFITDKIESTNWEEPQSALDWHHTAVFALIEAEMTNNIEIRDMYLDMAISALNEAIDYPLSFTHLALVKSLLGNTNDAIKESFSVLINLFLESNLSTDSIPAGLVFLPKTWLEFQDISYDQLLSILSSPDGIQQSIFLAAEILHQSQLVFYSPIGKRFLNLAAQLFPESGSILLKSGIADLMSGHWEGILQLGQVQKKYPRNSSVLQALFLASKELGQANAVQYWQQKALLSQDSTQEPSQVSWTQLPVDSPFTYITFQGSIPMAVEASFRSIVTAVLLTTGTWFEKEMEFWQGNLKPGMTVIDVGANVGVYTFSAAQQVGKTGRVLAVEPFSGCVHCLEETRRINQMDWVTICRGAASDHNGNIYLSLQSASELNEVTTQPSGDSSNLEEVPCFTLDSLVEQEGLSQVDILKIDAEGHELQVLMGSDRLLSQLKPVILYENIAGTNSSNLPVAEFLLHRGYKLYRYQPFSSRLLPLESNADFSSDLNIIAIAGDAQEVFES